MTTQEKYERAENEVFWIGEAIGYLKDVRNCEGIVESLRDRQLVAAFERDQYHAMLEQRDEWLDAQIAREHERDLI